MMEGFLFGAQVEEKWSKGCLGTLAGLSSIQDLSAPAFLKRQESVGWIT